MAIIPPILNKQLIESLQQRNTTPVNLNRRRKRPRYTGFTILRLQPEIGLIDTNDLRKVAREFGLDNLVRFLAQRPNIGTGRLIQSLSLDNVLKLEAGAANGKFPPKYSLASFWRLDTQKLFESQGDELIKRFVKQLNTFPEISLAYAEIADYGPNIGRKRLPLEQDEQLYRIEAPYGVDADWACTQPGGQGDNIPFVDLEQGWVFDHQELVGRVTTPPITGEVNTDPEALDHGTSVLGSIIGIDDRTGVLGVAANAAPVRVVSHYGKVIFENPETGTTAVTTGSNVADAIYAAIYTMDPGDVLLLEVEKDPGHPTEVDIANFTAIQTATSRNIIVIEAAGNAAVDLSTCCPHDEDSGAIMVGASQLSWQPIPDSEEETGEEKEEEEEFAGHDRFFDSVTDSGSNFGDRINCFAMGQGVSTAAGIENGVTSTDAYTFNFGGTSAAAAIIAGVALVVQGMQRAVSPTTRIYPSEMRQLLSDPSLGTVSNAGAQIKSMPDLRAIALYKGYGDFAYMRKISGKFCDLPNTNPVGTSFDILTCPNKIDNPTAYFSHLNPRSRDDFDGCKISNNRENYLYTRIRNCGNQVAKGLIAKMYSAPLATLVTPNLLKLIGKSQPITVPIGFTPVVTQAVPWKPKTTLKNEGHTLLVDLVPANERRVPLPEMQWQEFLATRYRSHAVAQRSVPVVEFRPRRPLKLVLPFWVTGAPDAARSFNLEWSRQLPDGVEVQWQVPLDLFEALSRKNYLGQATVDRGQKQARIPLAQLSRISFAEVKLPKSARYQSQLQVQTREGFASGVYSLAIRQIFRNNEVGRVTWVFKELRRNALLDLVRRVPFSAG